MLNPFCFFGRHSSSHGKYYFSSELPIYMLVPSEFRVNQSMLRLIKVAEPKMPKEYELLEGSSEKPKRIDSSLSSCIYSFIYKGEDCSEITEKINQFVNGGTEIDEDVDCATPDSVYIPETEEDEDIYGVDEAVE